MPKRVRIIDTEETRRLALNGCEGTVEGWTTPSVTGVPVIGAPAEDYAVNVHFDDLNAGYWFAEDLLDQVEDPMAGLRRIGFPKP